MSQHSRKPSSRAALPRRTTRGPLDGEDPLSPSSTLKSPAPQSPASSIVSQIKAATSRKDASSTAANPEPFKDTVAVEEKDLSFLLDTAIYHPLSTTNVPPPFRQALPQANFSNLNLQQAFEEIESCLSRCDFLAAAHLTGGVLTSGLLKPTDQQGIFRALQIRYACLELSGNLEFAALEAKALEDLGSAFYYVDLPQEEADAEASEEPPPRHIMPFSLRLQAMRLQSIGFSDPRRGVASLYDLALECREHIGSPTTSSDDRHVWEQRLQEIGMRVVNALTEMGDTECALRTLDSMIPAESRRSSTWVFRKALLCIRMGHVSEAHRLADALETDAAARSLVESLLAVADDRLDDAITILNKPARAADKEVAALAKQNAAVAFLYKGAIEEAKSMMESLVNDHNSFSALTVNLATVYDLTSDRARDHKLALAAKIASSMENCQRRAFTDADFKL
jgi:trafficking protein particle complex subunit 12